MKLSKVQLKKLILEVSENRFLWRNEPDPTRYSNTHATFSDGKARVLDGIETMKDGLVDIDNPKIVAAMTRLLDQMTGQVESLDDAYNRLKKEQEPVVREQTVLNEDLSLDVQPFLRMIVEAAEGLTEVAQRTKNPWIGTLAKFVYGVSSKANSAADAYFSKHSRDLR